MPEHVVLDVACDRAGRRVDGDDAAAIGAPARVRSVTLIERQIPEHDAARPAARGADDQLAREPMQRLCPLGIPVSARALGQVRVLVGMRVMHGGLCLDVAVVAVPGDAGDEARRHGSASTASGEAGTSQL